MGFASLYPSYALENRAAFRKQEMNPAKNKVWDSGPEFSVNLRKRVVGRFLSPSDFWGLAMYAMLVVALIAACLVNLASLFGHLVGAG